ncbi:TorF family putative porin [Ottowia testudinis]|uniref:Porin n=1 Tax=Ottowia testudinis TaxID=2816950 RepID=A0A975H4G8_9BURK|nr:TorF family putative porin [Ottowia testudinis]QTD46306.1 hypothetical protein J1M35_05255 [Ottowia testudinis]
MTTATPSQRAAWRRAALAAACALTAGAASAQTAAKAPADAGEPEIASYTFNGEVKLSSDRKTRGVSDTFNRPGLELTLNAAHESGLLGMLQLGTVSKTPFAGGSGATVVGVIGWRGGNPEGITYGAAIANEWFPGASFTAPSSFALPMDIGPDRRSNFNTTYLVGELGYKYLTARYLHVVSRDFRGINSGMACGPYLGAAQTIVAGGGDPTNALMGAAGCYGSGFQNSRGTQLIDLDLAYPLRSDTKLIAHLGWQNVRHFKDFNTVDYRLGVEHTRWGFVFGAEIAGAAAKNRDMFMATNSSGKTRRLDTTKLILTLAKRF